MLVSREKSRSIAAAKAGMSKKTARGLQADWNRCYKRAEYAQIAEITIIWNKKCL